MDGQQQHADQNLHRQLTGNGCCSDTSGAQLTGSSVTSPQNNMATPPDGISSESLNRLNDTNIQLTTQSQKLRLRWFNAVHKWNKVPSSKAAQSSWHLLHLVEGPSQRSRRTPSPSGSAPVLLPPMEQPRFGLVQVTSGGRRFINNTRFWF